MDVLLLSHWIQQVTHSDYWSSTDLVEQKGPEIRTGLTREGKDVRRSTTLHSPTILNDLSSGLSQRDTNSSSPPTRNTVKPAMIRLCGSIMCVALLGKDLHLTSSLG